MLTLAVPEILTIKMFDHLGKGGQGSWNTSFAIAPFDGKYQNL